MAECSYGLEQLFLDSVELQRQCADAVRQFSIDAMVFLGLSTQLLQQARQLAVLSDYVTSAALFRFQFSLDVSQLSQQPTTNNIESQLAPARCSHGPRAISMLEL